MPYGTVTDHGTMFVGFSADQTAAFSDVGEHAGPSYRNRDALTRYTRPSPVRITSFLQPRACANRDPDQQWQRTRPLSCRPVFNLLDRVYRYRDFSGFQPQPELFGRAVKMSGVSAWGGAGSV